MQKELLVLSDANSQRQEREDGTAWPTLLRALGSLHLSQGSSGPCAPLCWDSNSSSFLRLWGGAQRHWLPDTQRPGKWRGTWHCGQVGADGAGAKHSFQLLLEEGTQPTGVGDSHPGLATSTQVLQIPALPRQRQ